MLLNNLVKNQLSKEDKLNLRIDFKAIKKLIKNNMIYWYLSILEFDKNNNDPVEIYNTRNKNNSDIIDKTFYLLTLKENFNKNYIICYNVVYKDKAIIKSVPSNVDHILQNDLTKKSSYYKEVKFKQRY